MQYHIVLFYPRHDYYCVGGFCFELIILNYNFLRSTQQLSTFAHN